MRRELFLLRRIYQALIQMLFCPNGIVRDIYLNDLPLAGDNAGPPRVEQRLRKAPPCAFVLRASGPKA